MKEAATTSPYFTHPTWQKKSNSSSYFLRSPSSIHGAIRSLGPLIFTWTNEPVATCTRTSTAEICQPCNATIRNAMQHFDDCPKINVEIMLDNPNLLSSPPSDGASCVELVGQSAERQLRHLCPHQCFLRAFTPCRDWVALRKAVHEVTDQSIDSLLEHWTCQLVGISNYSDDSPKESISEEDRQKDDCQLSTSRKRPRSTSTSPRSSSSEQERSIPTPRTMFLCRSDGKCCSNVTQTLQALGLNSTSTENEEDNGLLPTNQASSFTWDFKERRLPPTSRRRLDFHYSNLQPPPPATGSIVNLLASPLGLLEELFGAISIDNNTSPWRLFLSTILLNRTRRTQVDRVMWNFLQKWPTPEATVQANVKDMTLVIARLGIKHRRARGIQQFSQEYLARIKAKKHEKRDNVGSSAEYQLSREEIISLYNCGEYAADAYQIFVQRDWKTIHPRDYALRAYVEWKQTQEEK